MCFCRELAPISTAKLMMAGNPSRWSVHPPSQQPSSLLSSSPSPSLFPSQYVLGSSSSHPFNSLTDNQELPQSWSQLLLYISLSRLHFLLSIFHMLYSHRFSLIPDLHIIFSLYIQYILQFICMSFASPPSEIFTVYYMHGITDHILGHGFLLSQLIRMLAGLMLTRRIFSFFLQGGFVRRRR